MCKEHHGFFNFNHIHCLINILHFQVIVGGNRTYRIGYLKYANTKDFGTLSKQLIISLSVGAVVLILILVICLIVYRQKSNQNSRVLKSMQEQMDILELRVAAECKEG